MVCLGPRDPGEIVGPRPLSGVVVRPLNFTVRSHARGSSHDLLSWLYIEFGLMLDDAGVQLTREAMLLWNVKRGSQL